ncbi:MAG: hypothetical protein V1915_05160 [Candidatus Bathyarchaeota archaeon]
MDEIIVIIDDTGSALGAVCMREKGAVLLDTKGKFVQQISIKSTVKEAKEILLRVKFNYIT